MSTTLEQEADRSHVAHLRIDFNDLNLLTTTNVISLRETIKSLPEDVSVLTIAADQSVADGGEVRGLTAGLNLEWAQDLTPHEGHDLLRAIYELNQSVRDVEAVVVCGCGEYTLGAGFELAIGCEFRVATTDAQLGLPEIEIGLPTVVQGGLLTQLVGTQTACELVYTGETITGERAADLRLVNRAVPPEDHDAAMADIVDTLAEKSPLALKLQKRVMNRFRSNGLEEGMQASIGDAGRTFGTHDQREAMEAFLEDRDPEFESR